jgi:hypothetical protein
MRFFKGFGLSDTFQRRTRHCAAAGGTNAENLRGQDERGLPQRSKAFLLLACILIALLSPLPATIQVGFPVLARSSTNQNNAYANWTGALTPGDCVSIDANSNFVDSGVAGCGGSGAGKGGIVVYSAASLTLTGTQYIPIGGGGLPSATETNVDTSAPSAATVTNFDVQMSSAPGLGNNIVFTWRKNAASQSLTCTISGAVATSCNDSTHSFLVSQGDLLTIQLVSTGAIVGTPNLVISTQFGTTGSNGTVNTATQFQLGEYLANGTAISGITVSPCLDTGGNHLNFNSATGAITCGTSTSGGNGTVTTVGFTGGLISVANPTTTPAFTVAGTSGGIPYFSTASTWASSAAGTAGHLMLWGGAGTAPTDGGVPGTAQLHSISFVIDGGGSTILTGDAKVYPTADFSCTINRWDISADQSGSVTVDVWKVNAAIPTSGNKISASAPLTLSTAQLAQNGSLTGWTLGVSGGDVFGFNVVTVTTVTRITGQIWCQ